MTDDRDDGGLLRCPTCAANQPPTAECRRCKCDLSLYVATLEHRRLWKRLVLRRLREHRYDDAIQAVRHYAALSPDDNVTRWIAVTHLFAGRFADAVLACQGVPTDRDE